MHPADQGTTGAAAEGVALAANDDRGPTGRTEALLPHAPEALSNGWDPFEVWRTRVRDPRREAAELGRG